MSRHSRRAVEVTLGSTVVWHVEPDEVRLRRRGRGDAFLHAGTRAQIACRVRRIVARQHIGETGHVLQRSAENPDLIDRG